MEYKTNGRLVQTLDEAQAFIREFIRCMRATHDHRVQVKSHDYDLYLPWLIEIAENLPVEGEEAPNPLAIERLYMEAAWDLTMKGLLRPGPRLTNNQNAGDATGKGYSLTYLGDNWIKETTGGPAV